MIEEILRLTGITGLILITLGVLIEHRKKEYILFALGGLFLIAYSVYIKDIIFIILQIIFTLAAIYNLIKTMRKRKNAL